MKRAQHLKPRVQELRGGIHMVTRGGRAVLLAVSQHGELVKEMELGNGDTVEQCARGLAELLERRDHPRRFGRLLRLER